jgi:hypothetical protein
MTNSTVSDITARSNLPFGAIQEWSDLTSHSLPGSLIGVLYSATDGLVPEDRDV